MSAGCYHRTRLRGNRSRRWGREKKCGFHFVRVGIVTHCPASPSSMTSIPPDMARFLWIGFSAFAAAPQRRCYLACVRRHPRLRSLPAAPLSQQKGITFMQSKGQHASCLNCLRTVSRRVRRRPCGCGARAAGALPVRRRRCPPTQRLPPQPRHLHPCIVDGCRPRPNALRL